jgi:exodeoxyribonuclease V alpha subunit
MLCHARAACRSIFLRASPPTSADGIEKYLSSGMIRGVEPVYAKKLVRAFGEKMFDIIETTPDARPSSLSKR